MSAEPENPPAPPSQDQVAAYLRAHPDVLAERPDLFGILAPPNRVHGPILADHMAAMLQAARRQATDMAAQADAVLTAGRAAAGIAERVQEAVLVLLQAADPAECVIELLPGLLGVDAAALCCEDIRPRWRTLPPGAIDVLLRARPVVFRDRPSDAALLHAEAALLAERDVLVRLPGSRPGLLALVSRESAALPNTQAWAFLGRVLAAVLA